MKSRRAWAALFAVLTINASGSAFAYECLGLEHGHSFLAQVSELASVAWTLASSDSMANVTELQAIGLELAEQRGALECAKFKCEEVERYGDSKLAGVVEAYKMLLSQLKEQNDNRQARFESLTQKGGGRSVTVIPTADLQSLLGAGRVDLRSAIDATHRLVEVGAKALNDPHEVDSTSRTTLHNQASLACRPECPQSALICQGLVSELCRLRKAD